MLVILEFQGRKSQNLKMTDIGLEKLRRKRSHDLKNTETIQKAIWNTFTNFTTLRYEPIRLIAIWSGIGHDEK